MVWFLVSVFCTFLLVAQPCANRTASAVRTIVDFLDSIFQQVYFGSEFHHLVFEGLGNEGAEFLHKVGAQVEVLLLVVGLQTLHFLAVFPVVEKPAASAEEGEEGEDEFGEIHDVKGLGVYRFTGLGGDG